MLSKWVKICWISRCGNKGEATRYRDFEARYHSLRLFLTFVTDHFSQSSSCKQAAYSKLKLRARRILTFYLPPQTDYITFGLDSQVLLSEKDYSKGIKSIGFEKGIMHILCQLRFCAVYKLHSLNYIGHADCMNKNVGTTGKQGCYRKI